MVAAVAVVAAAHLMVAVEVLPKSIMSYLAVVGLAVAQMFPSALQGRLQILQSA